MPNQTFASYAFGCRMNQAEKEVFDGQLIALGYRYSKDNPDIYIINTCAVTAKAEREARQHIYQVRRKWPKTKIIVTGCAGTKWMKERKNKWKDVLIIDNKDKDKIHSIISNLCPEGIASPDVHRDRNDNANRRKTYLSLYQATDKYLRSKRMILKIQDGCQRFCAYCIVPYLRGKPKSEKIRDIVKRIKSVEEKITEVILTAINTESYGLDTGEKLTYLVSKILSKTSIRRLSFGSINPWSIDKEFLTLYRTLTNSKRFVHLLHIPIQSGSDKILKLMKRDYSVKEISEKLNTIKKINPYAQIGTDIIVGFPGETDEDFDTTYKFLQKAPIDRFHVFRFSPREGTAAWYMRKKYPEATECVKNSRAKALITLGKKKYQSFLDTLVGKTMNAFIIKKNSDGSAEALLENQAQVRINSVSKINNLIDIKIITNNNGVLTGESI